jgi:2-polyprenyl-3-methyl-5-hydroxy-6-metoxy-1,4-benzoquinol methylase
MIPPSACPSWQPDIAANAAQEHHSYTTFRDTISAENPHIEEMRTSSSKSSTRRSISLPINYACSNRKPAGTERLKHHLLGEGIGGKNKMGSVKYLTKAMLGQFSARRFHCPNCGSAHHRIIDRKYVITQLRRCVDCRLMFRTPTDDKEKNPDYYEHEYSQGLTTDLPRDNELCVLIETNFRNSEKFWGYYNSVLARLGFGAGARIFDFGCSWGYGSYQMMRAGYRVTSFEIAPTRRRFATNKLGVHTIDKMDRAAGNPEYLGAFDCFFSSHVIEHVPEPDVVFRYARALLRTGGVFVSFTPNGSEPARVGLRNWSNLWGEVHPNFIDVDFMDRAFHGWSRMVGTSPVDPPQFPKTPSLLRANDLSGYELFFAAMKP